MRWFIFLVLAFSAFWSCTEEEVIPPVIGLTVNGEVIENEQDTIYVVDKSMVEYTFRIKASATISEVYIVKYTAKLIKNPENPLEYIQTEPEGNMSYPIGLTQSLEEEVKGAFIFSAPAYAKYGFVSLMIVVSDVNGNESRRSFYVRKI